MNEKKITLAGKWKVVDTNKGFTTLQEDSNSTDMPTTMSECLEIARIKELTEVNALGGYDIPDSCKDDLVMLTQLLICRDTYRDGWKPDWNNTDSKFGICSKLVVVETLSVSYPFTFQSKQIAKSFLNNFRDQLESIKEFL